MKSANLQRVVLPALVVWFGFFCLLWAGSAESTNTHRPPPPPVGGIQFDDTQQIDVQGVLQLYKAMSQLQLVVDSRAAQIHTTIKSGAKREQSFTRPEALKLIEKNLLEEAGVVLTHIDEKRVSVTYNDALPIKN